MNSSRRLVYGSSANGEEVTHKTESTISQLHLGISNCSENIFRLPISTLLVMLQRIAVRTFCMTDTTSTYVAIREHRHRVRKLDRPLCQL